MQIGKVYSRVICFLDLISLKNCIDTGTNIDEMKDKGKTYMFHIPSQTISPLTSPTTLFKENYIG